LAGFGDPVVVLVAAIFIVSEALVNTGVVHRLGEAVMKVGGGNESRTPAFTRVGTPHGKATVSLPTGGPNHTRFDSCTSWEVAFSPRVHSARRVSKGNPILPPSLTRPQTPSPRVHFTFSESGSKAQKRVLYWPDKPLAFA
jgi:hypothetical protein